MKFYKVVFFTHNDTMLVVTKDQTQLSRNEEDAGKWSWMEARDILHEWSTALGITGKNAKLVEAGSECDYCAQPGCPYCSDLFFAQV